MLPNTSWSIHIVDDIRTCGMLGLRVPQPEAVMATSRSEKWHIAEQWFARQKGRSVPFNTKLEKSYYRQGAQYFDILYLGRGFNNNLVATFAVPDVGDVRVTTDRRDVYEEVTFADQQRATERGNATEARFLKAAKERTWQTRKWFLRIKRAPFFMDQKGIDAITHIWVPTVGKVAVPIQIKSSEFGKQQYVNKHPDFVLAGVIILVIPAEMTDPQIRSLLFRELRAVRKKKVDPYKEFWKSIAAR